MASRRPRYSNDQLNRIYEKTDGCCHICWKKLAFINYGKPRSRAAWEVEHSRPVAKGGSHRMQNLLPSCVPCNRGKGAHLTTRSARRISGAPRAPYSAAKKDKIRARYVGVGGATGAAIGALAGGPVGMIIGALAGGAVGHESSPRR